MLAEKKQRGAGSRKCWTLLSAGEVQSVEHLGHLEYYSCQVGPR